MSAVIASETVDGFSSSVPPHAPHLPHLQCEDRSARLPLRKLRLPARMRKALDDPHELISWLEALAWRAMRSPEVAAAFEIAPRSPGGRRSRAARPSRGAWLRGVVLRLLPDRWRYQIRECGPRYAQLILLGQIQAA